MRSLNYSLTDVQNFITKRFICVEYKDVSDELCENEVDSDEETMCQYDDLEEVFTDHLLMGRRLQKTLYGRSFSDIEDPPDHPPIALTGLALELFSKAVPNDGLDFLNMDYVSHVSETARISPCAMIVAMIYLERLQLKNSEYLEMVSPSGLFVVTMLVASKFLFEDEDDLVTNQMWADYLNYDIKELNDLEREFLAAIDWKVLVDSSDYFNYLSKIEKIIAKKQSSLRNWLSYSDVCALLQDSDFDKYWLLCFRKILQAMTLWTVGYVATALTLHTASFALSKLLMEKQKPSCSTGINTALDCKNHANYAAESFHENKLIDMQENNNEAFLNHVLTLETPPETSDDQERNFCKVEYSDCNYIASQPLNPTINFDTNHSKLFLIDDGKTLSSQSNHRLKAKDNSSNCVGIQQQSYFICYSYLI